MLLGLAALFAVVNGANDGGAMVASTLRVPGLRALAAVATLAAALVIVPLILGTRVADTLTSGLVRSPRDAEATLVAIGVVAAVVVVTALTRAGLPTSLTLATVGGIVGAGVGRGLPVIVARVADVVLVGLAAPVVGALLALLFARVSVIAVAFGGARGLRLLGRLSSALQALAYAANDGQKMFAVVAVTAAGVTLPTTAAVAALFVAGTLLGVRTVAGTLGGRIARGGPQEEVTAQLGGSVAVLLSAALGVPVSMTQAVSGGLVGTGVLRGLRQVRWRVAARLGLAWLLTLPAAALTGTAVARAWGSLA